MAAAEAIYRSASSLPGIRREGVSCHIGSQIVDIDPLLEAADKATCSRQADCEHRVTRSAISIWAAVWACPTARLIEPRQLRILVERLRDKASRSLI